MAGPSCRDGLAQSPVHHARPILALLSVAACGESELEQQILRGVFHQEELPARVSEVRALRPDRRIAALDEVGSDGSFVLALPPGELYILEMRASSGAKIFEFEEMLVRVCRVEGIVDLGPILPFGACPKDPGCEKARGDLEHCKIDVEETCASIALSINDCRSHRELSCKSQAQSLDSCAKAICGDAPCQELEAACAEPLRSYDECLAQFDCAPLEASYIDACVEPCNGAFAEVNRSCGPRDPMIGPLPPTVCEGGPEGILSAEIAIGCTPERELPRQEPGP